MDEADRRRQRHSRRLSDAGRARGSGTRRPALRRHRVRHLRVVRQRRAVAAAAAEPARRRRSPTSASTAATSSSPRWGDRSGSWTTSRRCGRWRRDRPADAAAAVAARPLPSRRRRPRQRAAVPARRPGVRLPRPGRILGSADAGDLRQPQGRLVRAVDTTRGRPGAGTGIRGARRRLPIRTWRRQQAGAAARRTPLDDEAGAQQISVGLPLGEQRAAGRPGQIPRGAAARHRRGGGDRRAAGERGVRGAGRSGRARGRRHGGGPRRAAELPAAGARCDDGGESAADADPAGDGEGGYPAGAFARAGRVGGRHDLRASTAADLGAARDGARGSTSRGC